MGSLPHFMNAPSALAAAAVAAPLLLLLYFLKLRRVPMTISSTLLWRKAIQDLQVNSPFQRLRRNLLLFLQMALLLLLCVALSQPIINYTQGAGEQSVILIDRSASMASRDGGDGRTRLEEAKRQAHDLIKTMGRNAQASVIAFDDSAQTISPFTADRRALDSAIDSIVQTDRKTSLSLAYEYVEAQSAFIPDQLRTDKPKPTVWLFSDGRAQDFDKLTLHAPLKYTPIGSDRSKNIGIVSLAARRNFEQPNQLQVFARLENYGPDTVKGVQVALFVDGALRASSRGELTLFPQRWTDAEREAATARGEVARDGVTFPALELDNAAVITVKQLNTEGDVLSADDSASVVVPPPRHLSVLLVSDGNFTLQLALGKPDRMLPPEYARHVVKDDQGTVVRLDKPYDVIVFDKYSPEALPEVGNYMYFQCMPPGTHLGRQMDADGKPTVVDNQGVLDWKRDHPLLQLLNLSKVVVASSDMLLPTIDSLVLVQGTKSPLMVLQQEGRRRHLVIPFDVLKSTWWGTWSWPGFMYNAMRFMSLGTDMDVRQSFAPGSAVRISRFNLAEMSSVPTSISLSGPQGSQSVAVPAAGDLVLPPLDHVGIYQTSPAIPGYEQIAVNLLDLNESNTLPMQKPPGGGAEAEVLGLQKARVEMWWYIVAAGVMPLLMIEWWVYTRRVHL